jgi:hypothetical protein
MRLGPPADINSPCNIHRTNTGPSCPTVPYPSNKNFNPARYWNKSEWKTAPWYKRYRFINSEFNLHRPRGAICNLRAHRSWQDTSRDLGHSKSPIDSFFNPGILSIPICYWMMQNLLPYPPLASFTSLFMVVRTWFALSWFFRSCGRSFEQLINRFFTDSPMVLVAFGHVTDGFGNGERINISLWRKTVVPHKGDGQCTLSWLTCTLCWRPHYPESIIYQRNTHFTLDMFVCIGRYRSIYLLWSEIKTVKFSTSNKMKCNLKLSLFASVYFYIFLASSCQFY